VTLLSAGGIYAAIVLLDGRVDGPAEAGPSTTV